MKKYIFLLTVLFVFYYSFNTVFAGDAKPYDEFNGERSYDQAVKDNAADDASKASGDSTSNAITVKVTEKIPGAGCVLDTESSKGESKIYKCTIQPGFTTVQIMIGQIVKWFTAIAALAGVLFIVINGIMLSMNGGEKEKIKGRITQTLSGLILLLLSGLILSIIAPWVYK